MSIIIGCDSFLALRNVRNSDLGRRLAGDKVFVLVDPNQYKGSLAACPAKVELDCLLEFNPHMDPTPESLHNYECTPRPESERPSCAPKSAVAVQ